MSTKIEGDTTPRKISGMCPNTQFTVTLINNERWIRTAELIIDGKSIKVRIPPFEVKSQTFMTKTGDVVFSLFESLNNAMRLPLPLPGITLGEQGNSLTFGSEKVEDEILPPYMNVYVHIDWPTAITPN